jgi:hypothetical protein
MHTYIIHAHIHTCIHNTYIHRHMHAYTHTYTHMYAHTFLQQVNDLVSTQGDEQSYWVPSPPYGRWRDIQLQWVSHFTNRVLCVGSDRCKVTGLNIAAFMMTMTSPDMAKRRLWPGSVAAEEVLQCETLFGSDVYCNGSFTLPCVRTSDELRVTLSSWVVMTTYAGWDWHAQWTPC